ncbi:MAG: UDP-N-acetylmuramoyl-tripeptide--D-alanyl-D-alanine ligase [Agathobacter sp.]|nr:UDP-N-acetylmuramoyl-tripeptide--D-alanyl-D-alanine ligase [Agathobacter sp.]
MLEQQFLAGMTLENIAKACKGTYVGDGSRRYEMITGAVMDSRIVEEGNLFFAIKGERVDGHDFIPSVFEKGAIAVISEHALAKPAGPYILVDSTLQAMKDLAVWYRENLTCKIVGVTGSVGKTSTKEMIASVLKQKYKVLKTTGNYNNQIGLPLTMFRIRPEHEVAVLEMGISDFYEMHRLATMANPHICVITNIGLCHLEKLGDRDGVLRAKTECFEHMTPGGTVILNGDDDKLSTKTVVNDKPAIFYGLEAKSNGKENAIYATDIKNLGFEGMEAVIHTPQGDFDAKINIPGEHNVSNALAATSVGLELGLSLDEIQKGIASAETIAGRTNFIRKNDRIIIDDCYNANPVSMEASLEVLSHATGRSVAVLGDMGELGANEVELHKTVGRYVGEKKIHTLFCAGELAANYASAAKEANPDCEVYYFETREEMVEPLRNYLQPKDSVLIKASHFMGFTELVEDLTK